MGQPSEARVLYDDRADLEQEIRNLHADGKHDEVRDLAIDLLHDLDDAYRRLRIAYDRALGIEHPTRDGPALYGPQLPPTPDAGYDTRM